MTGPVPDGGFGLARQGVRVAGAVAADDRDGPARAERGGARRTDVARHRGLRAARRRRPRRTPTRRRCWRRARGTWWERPSCPGPDRAGEVLVAVGEPVGERGAVEDVDLVAAAEVGGVVVGDLDRGVEAPLGAERRGRASRRSGPTHRGPACPGRPARTVPGGAAVVVERVAGHVDRFAADVGHLDELARR